MANKNDIEGDVGQIVAGDSVVGPSLNNVVNFNMGEKEEKFLTSMQRTGINIKVKELEAISGISFRVLYRELLNKFGAEAMKEFPRNKYNDACDHIDMRIAEYSEKGVKSEQPVTPVHVLQTQSDPVPVQIKEVPCSHCLENTQSLKKAHFRILVLFALMVLMMITEAFFLLFVSPAKASQEKATVEHVADQNCHFDGKVQSIGSTVRMADGIVRQCMDAPGEAPSYWEIPTKVKH